MEKGVLWLTCDEVLLVSLLGQIVTEFVIQDDNRFHLNNDEQPVFKPQG